LKQRALSEPSDGTDFLRTTLPHGCFVP
jgi:hypothetical protein